MLVEVISNKKRLKIVLSTIIASVVLVIIDAGVQYFKGTDFIRGYHSGLLSASFPFPNGFSAWLIVVIPLFLGLLIKGKYINKLLRILLPVLVVLLLFCLYRTLIRGAWLGFIISIILMIGFILNRLSFKIKLLYLYIGTGFLFIFLILPQPILSDIKYKIRTKFGASWEIKNRVESSTNLTEPGVNARLNLWKEALRMTKDYNFKGCGLNTYSIVARDYKSYEGGGIYPHNSYLQKLAETGLFGLFAFFGVLFVFFKTGFKYLCDKNDYLVLGLLSGTLAFLVHAFFDNHFYSLQLAVLFWYILGLTVAAIKLEKDTIRFN